MPCTRNKLRALAAAGATIVLLVVGAAPAQASPTGYEYMYTGPSPSTGYTEWNINTRQATVQIPQSGPFGSNCLTTWFDWQMDVVWPTSRHFDARAIRNCVPNGSYVSNTRFDPAPAWNWWYVGQQKLAFCHGPNHTTSGCINGPQAVIGLGSVNPTFDGGNWTTGWWARWSNGTTASHSGGDPRSSTS